MSFVYPNFLWAYFLIAIPIIIHLFNFRRYKTVYFSRVSFLKEVTEDSRSGNKLKHLLIMFSRILAILFLVTAFAQPFIPLEDNNSTESISSIYIDNSYSMQAQGQDGDLLNEAKNKAIDLVRSFDENEKINLITSDMLSIHQRFYSKSEVIEMIKNIDFSARTTSLSNILNLQLDLFNSQEKEANNRVFLFSDFQKTTSELLDFSREVTPTFFYQTVAENSGNIYIDSVWFETPIHRVNIPNEVHFRIYNNSDLDQNDIPVGVEINGNSPAPKRVSIPANSFIDDKIVYTDKTAGFRNGKLFISSSQLFFDDEFYFSYRIKEEIKILLISDQADPSVNIEQLYSLDEYYDCETASINTVSMENFKGKELVIFQNVNKIPSGIIDLSNKTLMDGGTVVYIPGRKADLTNWNSFLSDNGLPIFNKLDSNNATLNYFNSADPIYYGVFESDPEDFKSPRVLATYNPLVSSTNSFITLFGTSEGQPFFSYTNDKNGRVFLMQSPLDTRFTDFQNHALFAATFLRIAETSSFQSPLYMEIGQLNNFPLNQEIDEKNPIHLLNEDYGVDIIPQLINSNASRYISFSHLEDQINLAGTYRLDNSDSYQETVSINYDRSESNVKCLESEEIISTFENIGWNDVQPMTTSDGKTIEINKFEAKEYWRILLILALLFLAAEILLLKLWRK